MKIARVVGSVWATKKAPSLEGARFMVIKTLSGNHSEEPGISVATDTIGAGVGDTVLVVKGGGARLMAPDARVPVDEAIVGIIDSLELQNE